MTVKELKEALAKFPEDWKVIGSIGPENGAEIFYRSKETFQTDGELSFASENGNNTVLLSNWDPEIV